jgi:hypothetical protein
MQILDLQDRLQDQVLVRRALEKALSSRSFSHDIMTDKSIPKVRFLVVNHIVSYILPMHTYLLLCLNALPSCFPFSP